MKRKAFKVIMGAAVCIGCGVYGYTHQIKEGAISPLAFENIEALAQGEDEGNYFCYGSGDIPCANRCVKYRFNNLR